MKLKAIRVEPFEAALKRPFVTALGRKTHTKNVGVTVVLSDGTEGYGEASSSLALAHLSQDRLTRSLRALSISFKGADASDPGGLIETAWGRLEDASPAAAAFECALLSAVCGSRGLSLTDYFGGALAQIETDITISADDEAATDAAAREAVTDGFRQFKVKVGGKFSDDLTRVRAVRRACPKARVLLDGNQGLTPAGALKLVDACLKEGPVDLLEQPLPKDHLKKMPSLAKRCPVPIALDESVSCPADAVRAVELAACGAINIKVAKSGLLRSLQIAAVARAAGLKLMIGCMAETAAGLDASVSLALGTGFFEFLDLDSDHLLRAGGRPAGYRREGPRLTRRSPSSLPRRT